MQQQHPPSPTHSTIGKKPSNKLAPIWTNRPISSMISVLISPTSPTFNYAVLSNTPRSCAGSMKSQVGFPIMPPVPIGLTPLLAAGAAAYPPIKEKSSGSFWPMPRHHPSSNLPFCRQGTAPPFLDPNFSCSKKNTLQLNEMVSKSMFYSLVILLIVSVLMCIAISTSVSMAFGEDGGLTLPGNDFNNLVAHVLTFSLVSFAYSLVFALALSWQSRKLGLVSLVLGAISWGVAVWSIPFSVDLWQDGFISALPVISSKWNPTDIAIIQTRFLCPSSSMSSISLRKIATVADNQCLSKIAEAVGLQLSVLRALLWSEWGVISVLLLFAMNWAYLFLKASNQPQQTIKK